ncbi:hypothetical protein BLJ79_06980 [Arthrobacter sp. UCD-GKA]|uniref:hypothetical protein n=1 Tax=Arthrobacter sp. UCD-GKA TaxID=1913576 RepID=UPI0008DE3C4E|nr:hypothetical protein [Arthrobacter sp. UCD-GKA]OIH84948.1 hypothetical protein BLJ79_06980 [Arthrobacter sp. UCD-GKA]
MVNTQARFADLTDTLERGKTRCTTTELTEHIASITRDTWLQRILRCEVTGTTPAAHRLSVSIDEAARRDFEDEVFGSGS